jgi:hypothetical protein
MEMLLAAIAFTYSFSIADFQKNEKRVLIFPPSDSSEGSVDDYFEPYVNPSLDPLFPNTESGDLQHTLFIAEQSLGGFYFVYFVIHLHRVLDAT